MRGRWGRGGAAIGVALASGFIGAAAVVAQEADDARADAQSDEEAAAAIEWLADHPIHLASDPLGALESVPGVPPGFAARAENARALLPFRRLEDLLRVPGADAALLAGVRPYVAPPEAIVRMRGRIDVESRFGSLPRGERFVERAELARGALRFGGALERDPRERSLADYGAAWVEFRAGGARVVAGSFDADWGRGLVLSTARAAAGASPAFERALRAGRGLTAHRGVGEEGHLRGAAATAGGARWEAAVLLSRTRRDARVNDDGDVTSLVDGGLHRTRSEIAARDRLDDVTAAARVAFRARGGAGVGFSARATGLDPPLAPRAGSTLPSGRRDAATGVDFAAPLGSLFVSGEWAARGGGGAARVAAAEWRRGAHALALAARRYDADFRTLHAAPPAARDRPANEAGIAWRARTRLAAAAAEIVHDRWRDLVPSRDGAAIVRGRETRVAIEARRGARRAVLVASRKTRWEDVRGAATAVDSSDRYALRVQVEGRFAGDGLVALTASGVTVRSGGDARRGGYLHARLRLAGLAGCRPTLGVTRYAGDAGDVVPRLPETLVPGSVRFVSLASASRRAGTRASVLLERTLARGVRLSLAAALDAPRGRAAAAEGALSLRVGPSRLP